MKSLKIVVLIYLSTQILNSVNCDKPKIAIIGAGIGGTSCALFLRQLLKDNVDIDIFEKNKVGGRLDVTKYEGNTYEIGGFTISEYDLYVNEFIREFGLQKRPVTIQSIANCDKNHLDSMSFEGMLTKFYHFPTPNALNFLLNTRNAFGKIYKLQKEKKIFKTLSDFTNRILKLDADKNVHQCLVEENSDQTDLLSSEVYMNLNYGQSLRVPPLVGYFAFDKFSVGSFVIDGGNYQLAVECLKRSNAQMRNEKVIEVKRINNLKSIVISKDDKNAPFERIYDYVIVATSLAENYQNIKFTEYPNLKPITGLYRSKYVTIVEGNLKIHYPGLDNADGVVFLDEPNLDFALKLQLTEHYGIWKIQSDGKLTDERLGQLFFVNRLLKQQKWLAYPNYGRNNNYNGQSKCDFILDKKLYYINCIEWAASSVEMSIIGARNVALLIYKNIRRFWYQPSCIRPKC